MKGQIIELWEMCCSRVSRNSTTQRTGILLKNCNNKQKFENQEDKFFKSTTVAFQRWYNKKFQNWPKMV